MPKVNKTVTTRWERVMVEKIITPDMEMLHRVLGPTDRYWELIEEFLRLEMGEITWDWKYYSTGWSLKALLKQRNLFFLIPCKNALWLSFIFGDRAVAVIEKSKLPKTVIEEILAAKKYAEGRGLRMPVVTLQDVETVKALVRIKIKH